jgi:dihydroorotase-like cyclic amidohydrolase
MTKRGSVAKMAPPLRTRDDIEKLWSALGEGLVDVIASDAAGHRIESNEPLRDKIFDAPNGIPGLDTLFSISYDEGVNGGKITLPRLVELTCENPAKVFGLYPRKGVLRAGSDADLVLFDPSEVHTIAGKNRYLRVDYSMYEGRRCLGLPFLVMQRGEILMENGELRADPGRGKFIPGKIPP